MNAPAIGTKVLLVDSDNPDAYVKYDWKPERQLIQEWVVADYEDIDGVLHVTLNAEVMCPNTSLDQVMGNGRCPQRITKVCRVPFAAYTED